MKVVHVSYSLGTQSAPYRLHQALLASGVESSMLVHAAEVDGLNIWQKKKPPWPALVFRKIHKKRNKLVAWYTSPVDRHMPWWANTWAPPLAAGLRGLEPDVVNLHWISRSCIALESLRFFENPIVWTLHDVWPLTAGCHCNVDCTCWRSGCHDCPQLVRRTPFFDAARFFWLRKKRAFAAIPSLTIVCPSRWLAGMASQSPFFSDRKIVVIPNTLDTDFFSPLKQSEIRDKLDLPQNKKIILFGAANVHSPYKGFELFSKAVQLLPESLRREIHIVIFGRAEQIVDLGICETTLLGPLFEPEQLRDAYAAADMFCNPSKQDISSNTCLEASACGVPVAAFATGGIPEIVLHEKTGFIAPQFDCTELARGMQWLLESTERRRALGANAREHVCQQHGMRPVAEKYSQLYSELCAGA